MSEEELAELERLLGEATERPWRVVKNTGVVTSDACQVGRMGDFQDAELLPYCRERWTADTNLIVKAVNALPSLLAEIRASRRPDSKTEPKLPIAELRMLAATHGGDCSDQLAERAEKAEALLRQIAVNTDAEWGRRLALNYLGMDVPERPAPADGVREAALEEAAKEALKAGSRLSNQYARRGVREAAKAIRSLSKDGEGRK